MATHDRDARGRRPADYAGATLPGGTAGVAASGHPLLRRMLKDGPFLAVSLVFHALLLVVLGMFTITDLFSSLPAKCQIQGLRTWVVFGKWIE